jgi:hypothetical protein
MKNLGLAFAALLLVANVGQAVTVIAYDNTFTAGQPNQDFGNSLGLDFNVNQTIQITALGAYDSGLTSQLSGVNGSGVTVGIYDRTTDSLVAGSTTVTFTPSNAGTQINADAFLPVSFTLSPGSYSVVAFNDNNYNSFNATHQTTSNPTSTENSGGGLISFVGDGRYSFGFVYPTMVDGGPSNRYDAGTFQFSAVTPEPSTLIPAGMGLLMALGYACLRHRHAASASAA